MTMGVVASIEFFGSNMANPAICSGVSGSSLGACAADRTFCFDPFAQCLRFGELGHEVTPGTKRPGPAPPTPWF
jgi:hypothetical protein